MNKIHLIIPMAGAGARFHTDEFKVPKPLIEIHHKPFFYWATLSITKYIEVYDIIFIILEEHKEKFKINDKIKQFFPDAKIASIPSILNGAVLTGMQGVKAMIQDDMPIIFNDCDHAFISQEFNDYCFQKTVETFDGGLLTFESTDPKYSFLELDENNHIIRTVEKKAISTHAICGSYYFKNKEIFLNCANEYLKKCNYAEYFMSGVYNIMAEKNMKIAKFNCDVHVPFGTPEEYYMAQDHLLFQKLEE